MVEMALTSITPNWVEMPDELMLIIFGKLGAVEILQNAQLVCTHWRTISKDPALWKVIDMSKSTSVDDIWMENTYENLTKQAVYRSSGELISIHLTSFCTDDLIHYISQSSSKLQCLYLSNCYRVRRCCLIEMVKRLPQLEVVYLYDYIYIAVEVIEAIGLNCPQLKYFRLNIDFDVVQTEHNVDAFAIAKCMPELCHLQLHGNRMTDEGLQAILDGCPLLESLDVCRCFYLNIDGDLVQRCKKQIKEFKCSSEYDLFEYQRQEYENYYSDCSYENYFDYSD